MDDPHDNEEARGNYPDALTDADLDALAQNLIGTDSDPWDVMDWLGLACDWDDRRLRKKLSKGTNLRKVTVRQCHHCECWFRGNYCAQCKYQIDRRERCEEITHPTIDDGFNYFAIGHRGEHLATIYDIPRPWPERDDSDPQRKAAEQVDFRCWWAIQRWIRHGTRDDFWDFFIASLRWLPVVIERSYWIKGDKGDSLWICIGAAFDAIVKLRDHDPTFKLYDPLHADNDSSDDNGVGCDPTADGDDGIEFNYLNPRFERVTGTFRCRKYVRYIRDEAQKALNDNQKRVRKERKYDWAYFQRKWASGGSDDWFPDRNWANNDFLSEPELELYKKELFEEAAKRLDGIEDSMVRRVVALKKNNHDMTIAQIAETIERELGIRRDATTIARHLNEHLKDFVAWLDVKLRKGKNMKFKRATGFELPAEEWCATLGAHSDVPTGLWQAMQRYEFDASQFKKPQPRPTILSRPVLKGADESLGRVS